MENYTRSIKNCRYRLTHPSRRKRQKLDTKTLYRLNSGFKEILKPVGSKKRRGWFETSSSHSNALKSQGRDLLPLNSLFERDFYPFEPVPTRRKPYQESPTSRLVSSWCVGQNLKVPVETLTHPNSFGSKRFERFENRFEDRILEIEDLKTKKRRGSNGSNKKYELLEEKVVMWN